VVLTLIQVPALIIAVASCQRRETSESSGIPISHTLTYTPITAAPRDISQGQLDAAVRELRTLREAAMERPARTAFVTFRSRAAAACAAQTLSSPNGLLWTVRPAPPPAQVGCARPHRDLALTGVHSK
jgi:hypothetical protein